MATVTEKFESRRITTDVSNPSVELRYTVRDTNDDVEARAALADASPSSYDPWGSGLTSLPRTSITIEPVGDRLWDGVVRYGTIPQTNESVFAFDTGGDTQHITQSLQTVGAYGGSAHINDNGGAIGATPDGVEGVDITVPVYQFTETHYLSDDIVTDAYKGVLFRLTAKVNDAPFRGLDAGECLFLGASGSKRGSGDWEITFRFAGSPNRTNLTVGDIGGIDKKGWEYLWVCYVHDTNQAGTAITQRPVAVYVECVYESGDFGLLGI